MLLFDGDDLEKFINETKFDPNDSSRKAKRNFKKIILIIINFLKAINDFHNTGWVHHDIKPANLILLKDLQVKIIDLALSYHISEKHSGDDLDKWYGGGTPVFMAPENNALKAKHSIDPLSDYYSIGVTISDLLGAKCVVTDKEPENTKNFHKYHGKYERETIIIKKEKTSTILDTIIIIKEFLPFLNHQDLKMRLISLAPAIKFFEAIAANKNNEAFAIVSKISDEIKLRNSAEAKDTAKEEDGAPSTSGEVTSTAKHKN